MAELQSAIEFQVELGKFYNVDLFERGYYQLRLSLLTNPKAAAKVEVSLPKNRECHLAFPASIINGVAISKTFQIMYRSEEIVINDIILFKVNMLIDSRRIEECIQEADFQLNVELWFTPDDISPGNQDKIVCQSQRNLRLHFSPTAGLHHHIPVLFDYFHLCAVCLTVHGTLLALHQPYIYMPRNVKVAWAGNPSRSVDQPSYDNSYYNGPNVNSSPMPGRRLTPRTQVAYQLHTRICSLLLSSYESLQVSLEYFTLLQPVAQQKKHAHIDCRKKLEKLLEIANRCLDEEELLQAAQSDVAQLCAQNVIIWGQYLDLVSLNKKVTFYLARQHHLQRVKRFAEAFFTADFEKREMITCYEQRYSYIDLAATVRNSDYLMSIQPLGIECAELDGEPATMPIVFEDVFVEPPPARQLTLSSTENLASNDLNRVNIRPHQSPMVMQNVKRLSFTKNMRVDVSKHLTSLEKGVADERRTDCTLVGYRKIEPNVTSLGTFTYTGYSSRESVGSLSNYYGSDRSSVNSFRDSFSGELHSARNGKIDSSVGMPSITEQIQSLSDSMQAAVVGQVPIANEQMTNKETSKSPGQCRRSSVTKKVDEISSAKKFDDGNNVSEQNVSNTSTVSELVLHSDYTLKNSCVAKEELIPLNCDGNYTSLNANSDSVDREKQNITDRKDLAPVNDMVLSSATVNDMLLSSAIEDVIVDVIQDIIPGSSEIDDEKINGIVVESSVETNSAISELLCTEPDPNKLLCAELDTNKFLVADGTAGSETSSQSDSNAIENGFCEEFQPDIVTVDPTDLVLNHMTEIDNTQLSTDVNSDMNDDNTLASTNVNCDVINDNSQVNAIVISEPKNDRTQGSTEVNSEQMKAPVTTSNNAIVSSTINGPSLQFQRDGSGWKSDGTLSTDELEILAGHTDYSDDDSAYMSEKCTFLELLQDHDNRSVDSREKEESLHNKPSNVSSVQMTRAESLGVHSKSPPADLSKASIFSRTAGSQPTLIENKRITIHEGNRESLVATKSTISVDSGLSSSLPELNAPDKRSLSLLNPVTDEMISFITAKENLRRLMNYDGHIYSDFPTQASQQPYFWPLERPHRGLPSDIHLVVCVHGLDGNSADLRLVKTYLELCLGDERIDFLMSERNQQDTFSELTVLTERLVDEIFHHLEIYGHNPSRISFIGHSLGNLIIRSALAHPKMALLLPRLYTFLSLSGPHLGTLYNNSGLVNMGMWFMQKWKKSGSLLQLSLKDHPDPRQTFLYKLSQKPGLEFFKNILLVSSVQDRYVPYHSSRIELCKPAQRDTSSLGGVYAEMVGNLLQPIIYRSDVTLVRYDVYHALPNNTNSLIGRAAHIAVLDSEIFLEKIISVTVMKYFK